MGNRNKQGWTFTISIFYFGIFIYFCVNPNQFIPYQENTSALKPDDKGRSGPRASMAAAACIDGSAATELTAEDAPLHRRQTAKAESAIQQHQQQLKQLIEEQRKTSKIDEVEAN